MRRKRKLRYFITTFSGYWWVDKSWMKLEDIHKLKSYRSFSNGASALTFKKAKKIALKCPAEMVIVKQYYRHGKAYERETIVRSVENEKLSGV